MAESEIVLPKLHPKQQLAFDSPATDILFGGATRGGKSFWLRRSLIVWCASIPGLMCDIFRLNYDDVVKNHMEGDNSFPALLAPWIRDGLCKVNRDSVTFWNSSKIYLEYAADVAQVMQKHQGIPRGVRCFEEATQIDSQLIKWLSGWVSMSEDLLKNVPEKWKGHFPKIIHTTNPIGRSSPYYKREYVDPAPPYIIRDVGKWKRQYIPALVEDNPSENAEETRARIGAIGDEAIADALLNANWNALTGDFFPEWDPKRHVVKDFSPPYWWYRYRGFDWGVSDPFCVLWATISDGEPFRDSDGKERWFPAGSIIVYREWYGCDPNDPSKGNRMRNEDIAQGIYDRTEYEHRMQPTLADSKPFQDMGGRFIESIFSDHGVPLTRADTSRVAGWAQLRSRLIGKEFEPGRPRIPMFFCTESCTYLQQYMPALTRHKSESKKEDAQDDGEATHACDTARYIAMAHAVIQQKLSPTEARIQKTIAQVNKNTANSILRPEDNGRFF